MKPAKPIRISLRMSQEIGSRVIAREGVKKSIRKNSNVKIVPTTIETESGGGFGDETAMFIEILSSAVTVAAVKGVFDIIKTAIIEAKKTRRQQESQSYELQKMKLILGKSETEINIDDKIQKIRGKIDELEKLTIKQIKLAA